ncbi:MAG: 1,4-dihydroxy-2-naphthoate octaprenyltransferase [Desulfobacterota bacterium]|jgi:1,4-dihydroxy-2-naphthoate octaprenyltransferase|nr:1,4-dihydroxy-2-naphthoate octaprenyltransferase [Thermodesulfobacteriota bacterium]
MSQIALWWRAARPFAFTVSLIPPILGGLIAAVENPSLQFNLFHFILSGIGCMTAHAGANILSDYYDFKTRVDREGTFGSSGLLVAGIMSPEQMLRGGWVALVLAGIIGAYLVFATPGGLFLVWLILLGGLLGIFYTAKPFEFKYHALGDLAVFISFGPAMVLGAYFVQAHHFSWKPVLYSIPIGFLVDAVLHSNNLRDIVNDGVVKIKTVPILIGEKWAKIMYQTLVFGAYLLTLLLVVAGGLTAFALLVFVSLPLAFKVVHMVRHKERIPAEKFAVIDAATAQVHLAFGLLMVIGLALRWIV